MTINLCKTKHKIGTISLLAGEFVVGSIHVSISLGHGSIVIANYSFVPPLSIFSSYLLKVVS